MQPLPGTRISPGMQQCPAPSLIFPQLLTTTFKLDLRRRISDDFRNAFVIAYLAGHANMLAPVRFLGIAELRAITAPNEHGENRVWVGLVDIDEGRISATPCRVVVERPERW